MLQPATNAAFADRAVLNQQLGWFKTGIPLAPQIARSWLIFHRELVPKPRLIIP